MPRARGVGARFSAVPVEVERFPVHRGTGNVVFFFRGSSKLSGGEAFKEIVFTQVSERGLFWQECREVEADRMYHALCQELEQVNN